MTIQNHSTPGLDDRRQGRELAYALAYQRMTDALLTERDAPRVLEALARIAGETLGVDRSLIYEIREEEQQLVALCEWLNPEVEVSATKATYPLNLFHGGNVEIKRTKRWLESHSARRHPALESDGSAGILHEHMAIKSLLWFPFDFRTTGYFSLVFNQVSHPRDWQAHELEFLGVAIRHVELALLQIVLEAERADAERRLLETQKAESISVLAAGVAHDFNGLLGIVLGAVGRTRAALGDDSPHASSLRDAERAAREAADLAKHLLAYAGGGQFVVETLDLAALVLDMKDLLRAAAGHVTLEFALEEAASVVGDAGQLRQVLMNFVVNAVESIAARGEPVAGTITVQVARERSGAQPRVVLSVKDTGCGMPAEVAQRVFEPFFSTKALGRGLGLAATSGIARAHQAELSVVSTVGEGSTFSVSFPEATGEASSMTIAVPKSRRGRPGETVLLVDDSDNFRRMCKSLLSDLGYRTIEATDGDKAVEALRANVDAIDAAVLDWTMPGRGGADTFRRLRELRPDLPVVVMSGYAAGGTTDLVIRGGAGFLQKPFSVEALEAALATVLGAAGRRGGGAAATA